MPYDTHQDTFPDLPERAAQAKGKLTKEALAEIREYVSGLERHEGMLLENKYEELTGKLLEPAIARFWLSTKGDWL